MKIKTGPKLHTFYNTLEYLDKVIYRPNKLIIVSSEEKKQNAEYAAGKFGLLKESTIRTIRFRVAKKTSNKMGSLSPFGKKIQKVLINLFNMMRLQI